MPEDLSAHESIARSEARDENGHFKHVEAGEIPGEAQEHSPSSAPSSPHHPLEDYISTHTHYSKSQDDLLDVHVGNPLEKVVKLLEDIKKQKAFSFTLKGSLGIAGVVLTLGFLGVFGGGQILCSHGTQSMVGVVRTLNYSELEKSKIPYFANFMSYFSTPSSHRRIVLIRDGNNIINIPYNRDINLSSYEGQKMIITGNYNSCSQTLTVSNIFGIEAFGK